MREQPVVLHELALPGGARFRPLGEPELRIAARVEGGGPASPAGREGGDPAWAEAAGAKLQGSGAPAGWGEAFVPESLGATGTALLRARPLLGRRAAGRPAASLVAPDRNLVQRRLARTPAAPPARARPAHGTSRPHRRAAAAGGAARRRRMVLGWSAFAHDCGRMAPVDEELLRCALLPPARRHGPPIRARHRPSTGALRAAAGTAVATRLPAALRRGPLCVPRRWRNVAAATALPADGRRRVRRRGRGARAPRRAPADRVRRDAVRRGRRDPRSSAPLGRAGSSSPQRDRRA